jgi:hypothetical protein
MKILRNTKPQANYLNKKSEIHATYIHVYIHTDTHPCSHKYAHIIYMYVNTWPYTHTYIHTYTHVHTSIHTHIHTSAECHGLVNSAHQEDYTFYYAKNSGIL